MLADDLVRTGLTATIVLAIAVFIELRLANQPIEWRSRALGGAFISAIVIAVAVVAYALRRLWDVLGVPPLLPLSSNGRGLPPCR